MVFEGQATQHVKASWMQDTDEGFLAKAEVEVPQDPHRKHVSKSISGKTDFRDGLKAT